MALTPEDVVNKRFQTTKFREGYDQDEVDDFLDEIVIELRRLNQENDELRRQVSELQSGGSVEETDVPAPVSADGQQAPEVVEPAVEDTPAVEEPVAEPEPVAPAAPAAPAVPQVSEATPAPAATESTDSASSAAGVLAMAQRLHDEYVAEGEKKRDEIITQAETEADQLVSEAKDTRKRTLDDLERKKVVLEREVEELRGFERDYRSRLRSFIEGQLQDLDSQANISDK